MAVDVYKRQVVTVYKNGKEIEKKSLVFRDGKEISTDDLNPVSYTHLLHTATRHKNCRIIALFVPGGRVQGTIYRKPVYEREAGLYRG